MSFRLVVSPSRSPQCTTRTATQSILASALGSLIFLQIACSPVHNPGTSAQASMSPNIISVSVSPQTIALTPGAIQRFTASVQGSANTEVRWSASAGTVSNTGLFTAPTSAPTSTMTVTAISMADTARQASANVSLENASPTSQPAQPFSGTNSIAGGITALPPAQPLGSNQVANSGFESGATGWTLSSCFSIDSKHAYEGSHSLTFNGGSAGCGNGGSVSQTITRGPGAARSYTLQGWVLTTTGSNLQVKLALHDESAGGDIVGGTSMVTPGATWTFIQKTNIDLLPIHDGDTLSVVPIVQGTSGMAWFDDIQLVEQLPLPVSSFLLYPNYKGYLWGNGPQTIRLKVEVPNPTNMQVRTVLQDEKGGSPIAEIQHPAQSTEELDLDGSGLSTGSYLVSTQLLDTANNTVATYPSYRINKVASSFQGTLVNYIDTDNFLVRKGKKRFVWGVYDRWSSHRCKWCVFTTEAPYLQIPGFNGLSTVHNYPDTLSNAEMNILPFVGVNVTPTKDQLTPWLNVMDSVGVGHLQIVNNWFGGARGQPAWQQGISQPLLWQMLTKTQAGQPGGLGYYTYDEPTVDKMSTVFSQWPTLSAGDPGGVTFGTLARMPQVWRWRDMADVMSTDPYPVGSTLNADDFSYGARSSPPMMRTSIWTRETVRQSYGSRPVWMVLQTFDFQNQFPTYAQMKMQAYKAIINGATGILWWGFVSQQGIEYEWYVVGSHQPYLDFKRISQEVMALEPLLISTPQEDLMSSVSDPSIEYLIKSDSTKIVVFASNFSDVAIGNVTFNLSSLARLSSAPVEVYSEGRTVPINGSSFTDSFGANDVHVYEVNLQR